MKLKPLVLLLCALFLAAPFVSPQALAEDEDVELALEPPDEGSEAVSKEALSEEERRLQELVEEEQGDIVADPNRREPADLDVPQVSDGRYESRESNQQMKILRYHRERLDGREYLAFEGEEDSPKPSHSKRSENAVFPQKNKRFRSEPRNRQVGRYKTRTSPEFFGKFA